MARGSGTRDAVLVPTGSQMKSYACMRSLGQRGIPTVVGSELETIPHFASRYCSERVSLPSPWEGLTAYRDALLSVAAREDVATVVPVRECDVYLLAKYRDAFEEHVSPVAPRLDALERAHDRLRLARAAERAGVPMPETRLLSEVDEWDERLVIKSRYNILTGEYVDGYSPDDVREVKSVRFVTPGEEPATGKIRDVMGHDPVVQEFVPQADKHLYTALWDHGEPLSTYQHRQLRQNSWVGGGGVYRESAYSQTVEDAAYDLLSELDWHGFACIEYLQDADTGEWKPLEVNPRVWQSIAESVRAGVDFPYHYWLLSQGRQDRIEDDYETGVGCHIAYGEVAHLLSVLRDDSPFLEPPSFRRTLWDIATSCAAEPRFDYLRLDDPRLFLSGLRHTVKKGVSRSRSYDGGGGQ